MTAERIDKRIEWLDEQRRKDAEALSKGLERIEAAEEALQGQAKQVQAFASELARLAGIATRIREFDEALAKHRKDVNERLATGQKQLITRQKDLESMWKADQKRSAEALDGLRQELRRLEQVEQDLGARRAEEERMRKELERISKDLEQLQAAESERKRAMAVLDQATGQTSRRMAEAQADLGEVRTRSDSLQGQLESVQDRIRRLEADGTAMAGSLEELREAQRLWRDQQAAALTEFERQWKDWEKRFDAFEQRAAELDERILSYEETYRSLLQLKSDFEQVIERLERRISEVSELQRLAEDRMKQDWSAFRADDQKRWSGFQLTAEERWKDHDRIHKRVAEITEQVQADLDRALHEVSQLREVGTARMLDALSLLREWASEVDRKLSETR